MTSTVDPQVRQEIAELLVRYGTGIDRRDWTAFASCFTDEVDADYGDIGRWQNVRDITNWMREVHEACGYTLHRITNISVEASGSGVTARSYVDAIVLGPYNQSGANAVGFYDDELVSTADGWRIARRRFTTVFVRELNAPAQGATPAS